MGCRRFVLALLTTSLVAQEVLARGGWFQRSQAELKTTVMCQTKSALNLLVISLQTNSGVVNYTSQIVQDSGNSDALVVSGRALFVKQWSTVQIAC